MKITAKVFIFSLAISLIHLSGCKKTDMEGNPSNINPDTKEIENAKSYFENNFNQSHQSILTESTNGNEILEKNPAWEDAYITTLSIGPAVIIPLKYVKKVYFKTNLDNKNIFEMGMASQLVIYKDKEGKYQYQVVHFYKDGSHNSRFSGIVRSEDWNGNLINEFKYEGTSTKQFRANNSSGLVSTNTVIVIETDYTLVTYVYSIGNPSGGTYNYQNLGSSFSFVEVGNGAIGSANGLSGEDYNSLAGKGGAKVNPANILTVYRGDNPITNISDYIKCFNANTGSSYTVTLCIDQPNAGSRDAYTSGNSGLGFSVGHTFIVFSQNSSGTTTTRSIGLYPNGNVTPVSPVSKGSLNNDEGHRYNVSLSINTTGSQFMNILNSFANGNNVNYNLNSNNCTTWALSSLATGGININTTPGQWPFGQGDDPGDLGEDVRSLSLGSNMSRSTTSNNAPSNVGTCP